MNQYTVFFVKNDRMMMANVKAVDMVSALQEFESNVLKDISLKYVEVRVHGIAEYNYLHRVGMILNNFPLNIKS